MDAQYVLAEGLYLYPTPAGAYYALSSTDADKPRRFIRSLLTQARTPELNPANLNGLMQEGDAQKCLELLHHYQKVGWIQGVDAALTYPAGALEDLLPGLLVRLSENGKVLLADSQGFYLATHGFPHEVAEELSALSAEIATVHDRRSGLLVNNMGLASQAWGIIDAFGNNEVGFWPLFVAKNRFVLAIYGIPHFNQPEFVTLAWALSMRYATN